MVRYDDDMAIPRDDICATQMNHRDSKTQVGICSTHAGNYNNRVYTCKV